MQGWPSPRSGEDPAAPTLGQVAPAKACGAGGKDRTGVGRGLLVGTEGGTWEARLWPPGPEHTLALPPPTAALPRASVSLSAEAPCRRGVWRGARLRVPTPTLRSSQPAAPLSQTNRGGDKVAPTRICHSSRRRPQSSPDDALGPLARRDGDDKAREAGGAAADSTARPRSVCPAVSAGCTWGNFALPCCRPGGGHRGRPLCTAPGAFRPWEPAPLRHPDTAVPRAASETRSQSRVPGLQGPVQTLPRHPGLCGGSGLDPTGMRVSPSSLPRRTGGWMRMDEATRSRGMSGRIRAGASRARVGAAARAARARLLGRACRSLRLGHVSEGASGGQAVGDAG